MSAAPALLAGLAVAVWLGLPRAASARVDAVVRRSAPWRPAVPRVRLLDRVRAPAGRRGRREGEQARAVEACAVLSGELRAGRPAAAALEAAVDVCAGPTRGALRAGAAAAALGGDVPSALGSATDSAVPGLLRGLAACWAVCASTGSGLASAVERLAEAERAAAEQRRAVEVELAGPRATARMLALLPVVGLLMAGGLGAQPLSFLLGSPVGRICLLLGIGLEVLGLRWTARLAAGAARRT